MCNTSSDFSRLASKLRIAIVGSSGAVGCVALSLLEEQKHPPENLLLLGSHRSAGKHMQYGGYELTIEKAHVSSFENTDVVFISANSEVSKTLAPAAVKSGALVIDDSSAFRMNPAVPLVVPEVNSDDIANHYGIVSVPNCSTTPLVMILAALRALANIESVIVSTYQAVTGAGEAAHRELMESTAAFIAGKEPQPENYPHPIPFNVIPQIDTFSQNAYTLEEQKIMQESKKILHSPDLRISATCVRVPVKRGHSAAVNIQFSRQTEPKDVREALVEFPGISVMDVPDKRCYPTPRISEGKNEVIVGRIRKDMARENSISLWFSCDNLRKGAALNALQILHEIVALENNS